MLTFAQEFESLSIAVSAHEAAQQYANSKQIPDAHENQRLLLNLLRDNGPMTSAECAERSGLGGSNVRYHLSGMVERGEAILINTGTVRRYGLPEHRST